MREQHELQQGLQQLGLDAQSSRVLALLPLIMVAWADGRVQVREQREIERLADEIGLVDTKRSRQVLRRWLARPLERAEQHIGLHVLRQLAQHDDSSRWSQDSLEALVGLCYQVADASGSLLGLTGNIGAAERNVIEDIAAKLSVTDVGVWQRLYGLQR